MRRGLLLGAALVAAAVAHSAPSPPTAAAAGQVDNRAGVVVDLGNGDVRKACIVFSEASVTGLDALRAAQTDPVVQAYSGQGGAVCALCGHGCPAGSSCLTCKSPDYWQYWRADDGAEAYTYSRAGAGSVQVTDGDVEAWRWGSGQSPPPLYTVSSLCDDPDVATYRATASPSSPPPPSPTGAASTTTTAVSGSASPAAPAPSTTAAAAPRPSGGVAGVTTVRPVSSADLAATPDTTAGVAGTTSTSVANEDEGAVAEGDEGRGRGTEAAGGAARSAPAGAGSSRAGYLAFALILAALVAMTVRARTGAARRAREKGVR